MKLASENVISSTTDRLQIHLPYGLIGLPELVRFDLAPIAGSWPLLSMHPAEGAEPNFVVIEPHTLVGGYDLEISDDDVELLQIASAADVLVLNLVTVHSLAPQHVTVNLVGPVLVNRDTLIGKQVIIANFDKYAAQHVLIDERQSVQAA